jgi:hypothetical protein
LKKEGEERKSTEEKVKEEAKSQGESVIKLASGEFVRKEFYNQLSDDVRKILDKDGLSGFSEHVLIAKAVSPTNLESSGRMEKLSTGEWVEKGFYNKLSPEAQRRLNDNGVDAYNSYYASIISYVNQEKGIADFYTNQAKALALIDPYNESTATAEEKMMRGVAQIGSQQIAIGGQVLPLSRVTAFINESLDKGVDESEINDTLRKAGFSDEYIKQVADPIYTSMKAGEATGFTPGGGPGGLSVPGGTSKRQVQYWNDIKQKWATWNTPSTASIPVDSIRSKAVGALKGTYVWTAEDMQNYPGLVRVLGPLVTANLGDILGTGDGGFRQFHGEFFDYLPNENVLRNMTDQEFEHYIIGMGYHRNLNIAETFRGGSGGGGGGGGGGGETTDVSIGEGHISITSPTGPAGGKTSVTTSLGKTETGTTGLASLSAPAQQAAGTTGYGGLSGAQVKDVLAGVSLSKAKEASNEQNVGEFLNFVRTYTQPEYDAQGRMIYVSAVYDTQTGKTNWVENTSGIGIPKTAIRFDVANSRANNNNILVTDNSILADANNEGLTDNWISPAMLFEAFTEGKVGYSGDIKENKKTVLKNELANKKAIEDYDKAVKEYGAKLQTWLQDTSKPKPIAPDRPSVWWTHWLSNRSEVQTDGKVDLDKLVDVSDAFYSALAASQGDISAIDFSKVFKTKSIETTEGQVQRLDYGVDGKSFEITGTYTEVPGLSVAGAKTRFTTTVDAVGNVMQITVENLDTNGKVVGKGRTYDTTSKMGQEVVNYVNDAIKKDTVSAVTYVPETKIEPVVKGTKKSFEIPATSDEMAEMNNISWPGGVPTRLKRSVEVQDDKIIVVTYGADGVTEAFTDIYGLDTKPDNYGFKLLVGAMGSKDAAVQLVKSTKKETDAVAPPAASPTLPSTVTSDNVSATYQSYKPASDLTANPDDPPIVTPKQILKGLKAHKGAIIQVSSLDCAPCELQIGVAADTVKYMGLGNPNYVYYDLLAGSDEFNELLEALSNPNSPDYDLAFAMQLKEAANHTPTTFYLVDGKYKNKETSAQITGSLKYWLSEQQKIPKIGDVPYKERASVPMMTITKTGLDPRAYAGAVDYSSSVKNKSAINPANIIKVENVGQSISKIPVDPKLDPLTTFALTGDYASKGKLVIVKFTQDRSLCTYCGIQNDNADIVLKDITGYQNPNFAMLELDVNQNNYANNLYFKAGSPGTPTNLVFYEGELVGKVEGALDVKGFEGILKSSPTKIKNSGNDGSVAGQSIITAPATDKVISKPIAPPIVPITNRIASDNVTADTLDLSLKGTPFSAVMIPQGAEYVGAGWVEVSGVKMPTHIGIIYNGDNYVIGPKLAITRGYQVCSGGNCHPGYETPVAVLDAIMSGRLKPKGDTQQDFSHYNIVDTSQEGKWELAKPGWSVRATPQKEATLVDMLGGNQTSEGMASVNLPNWGRSQPTISDNGTHQVVQSLPSGEVTNPKTAATIKVDNGVIYARNYLKTVDYVIYSNGLYDAYSVGANPASTKALKPEDRLCSQGTCKGFRSDEVDAIKNEVQQAGLIAKVAPQPVPAVSVQETVSDNLTLVTPPAEPFTQRHIPAVATPEMIITDMDNLTKLPGVDVSWSSAVKNLVGYYTKDGVVDYGKVLKAVNKLNIPRIPPTAPKVEPSAVATAPIEPIQTLPIKKMSPAELVKVAMDIWKPKVDATLAAIKNKTATPGDVDFYAEIKRHTGDDGKVNYLGLGIQHNAYLKAIESMGAAQIIQDVWPQYKVWGITARPLFEVDTEAAARDLKAKFTEAVKLLSATKVGDYVDLKNRLGLAQPGERATVYPKGWIGELSTPQIKLLSLAADYRDSTATYPTGDPLAGQHKIDFSNMAERLNIINKQTEASIKASEQYARYKADMGAPQPFTPTVSQRDLIAQRTDLVVKQVLPSYEKVEAAIKDRSLPVPTDKDIYYHSLVAKYKKTTTGELNANAVYEEVQKSKFPFVKETAQVNILDIPAVNLVSDDRVIKVGQPSGVIVSPAGIRNQFGNVVASIDMPKIISTIDMSDALTFVDSADGTKMVKLNFNTLSPLAQDIYRKSGFDTLEKEWANAENKLSGSPYSYKDVDGNVLHDIPAVLRSNNQDLISAVYLIYTNTQIENQLKGQEFTKGWTDNYWNKVIEKSDKWSMPSGLNLKALGIEEIPNVVSGMDRIREAQLVEFGNILQSPSLHYNIAKGIVSSEVPEYSVISQIAKLDANLKNGTITQKEYDTQKNQLRYESDGGDLSLGLKAVTDIIKLLPSTVANIEAYDPIDKSMVVSSGGWYVDTNGVQRPIPVDTVIQTTYDKKTDTYTTKPVPIPKGMIAVSDRNDVSVMYKDGKAFLSYNVQFKPKKPAYLGEYRNVSEYISARGDELTKEVFAVTPPPLWPVYAIGKGAADLGLTIPLMMYDQAGIMRDQIVLSGKTKGDKRTEALNQALNVPISLAGGMAGWFAQRPSAIHDNPAFELPYTLTVLLGPKWVKDVGVGAYNTVTGLKPTATAIENYIMAYYNPNKLNFETVRKSIENAENAVRGMLNPQELAVTRESIRPDAQKRVAVVDTIQTKQGTPVTERVYIEDKVSTLSSDRDIRGYRVDTNPDGSVKANKNGLVKIERGGSVLYIMEAAARRVKNDHMMSQAEFVKAVENEIDSSLLKQGGMYGQTIETVVNHWRDIVKIDPDIAFSLRQTPSNKVRPDLMYSTSRELDNWRSQINRAARDNSHIAISADVGGDLPAVWFSNHAAFGFMDRGRPEMGNVPVMLALITDINKDFKNIGTDVVNKLWWGDSVAARELLSDKVKKGELNDAMYNVAKVVRASNHAELEAMAFPGYDQIVPIPKNQIPWYARKSGWDTAVIPTRSPVTILNPDGSVFINQGDIVLVAYLITKNALASGKKVPSLAELTLMQTLAFTVDARKLLPWEREARRPADETNDRIFTNDPSSLRAMVTYDRSASVLDTYNLPNGEIGWIRNPRPRLAMEGLQNPMGGTMREGVEVIVIDNKGRIGISNSFDEPRNVASHIGGAIDPFDYGNMIKNVQANLHTEGGLEVDVKDIHEVGIYAGMRKNHTFPGNRVYVAYIGDQFPSTTRGTIKEMSPEMRWTGMWDGRNVLELLENDGRNVETRKTISGKLPMEFYPASADVLQGALEVYRSKYPTNAQPNIDMSQVVAHMGRNFKDRGYTELTNARTFVTERNKTPYLRYVTRYTADQLADGRIFMNKSRDSGYALSSDGEIMNLFSNGKSGEGSVMLVDAILRGGTHLNCYDGYLKGFYENFGFRVTRRQPSGVKGTPDTLYMEYAGRANNGADIVNYVINKTGKTPKWTAKALKEMGTEVRKSISDTYQEYALSNDFRDLLKFRDQDFSKRVIDGKMMTEDQLRTIAQKRQKENVGAQPWITPPQVNILLLDLARKVQNKIRLESPNQSIYYAQTPVTYAFYLVQQAIEASQKKAEARSQRTGVDIDTAFAEEMGIVAEKISKIDDIDKIRQTLELDNGKSNNSYVENIPEGWNRVGLIEALPVDAKVVLGKDGNMYSDKKGVAYTKDIVNDRVSQWLATESEFKDNFVDVYLNATGNEPSLVDMNVAWNTYNNRKPSNITNQEIYNVAQMTENGRQLWKNVNNGLISSADYQILLDNSVKYLLGYSLSKEKMGDLVKDYVVYKDGLKQGKFKYSDAIVDQIKVDLPKIASAKFTAATLRTVSSVQKEARIKELERDVLNAIHYEEDRAENISKKYYPNVLDEYDLRMISSWVDEPLSPAGKYEVPEAFAKLQSYIDASSSKPKTKQIEELNRVSDLNNKLLELGNLYKDKYGLNIEVGVYGGRPYTEIKASPFSKGEEALLVDATKGLPPINKGDIRLVHSTSKWKADKIGQEGFTYLAELQHTTYKISDNIAESVSSMRSYGGDTVVVMDIPESYYRMIHSPLTTQKQRGVPKEVRPTDPNIRGITGNIPVEYVKAIISKTDGSMKVFTEPSIKATKESSMPKTKDKASIREGDILTKISKEDLTTKDMKGKEDGVVPYKGKEKDSRVIVAPIVSEESSKVVADDTAKKEVIAEETEYAKETPSEDLIRKAYGESTYDGYVPAYGTAYGGDYGGKYGVGYGAYNPPETPPEIPPVPPYVPPYVPPPTAPKPVKPTPPLPSAEKYKRLTVKQIEGAIAWKQGWCYKMIYPPFSEVDIINSKEPLAEVKYFKGPGSAAASIIARQGSIPPHIKRDMGIVDVNIFGGKNMANTYMGDYNTKPIIKFKPDSKQKTKYSGIVTSKGN